MSLDVVCYSCGSSLDEPGGILLGPPNELDEVKKHHICKDCYGVTVHENAAADSAGRPIRDLACCPYPHTQDWAEQKVRIFCHRDDEEVDRITIEADNGVQLPRAEIQAWIERTMALHDRAWVNLAYREAYSMIQKIASDRALRVLREAFHPFIPVMQK